MWRVRLYRPWATHTTKSASLAPSVTNPSSQVAR
jgi:hypothetical protein